VAEAAAELAARSSRPDLAPDPHLPDDTRLWAALQQASGGTWAGCVYDNRSIVEAIVPQLRRGRSSFSSEDLRRDDSLKKPNESL
jgi:hypothetical protein